MKKRSRLSGSSFFRFIVLVLIVVYYLFGYRKIDLLKVSLLYSCEGVAVLQLQGSCYTDLIPLWPGHCYCRISDDPISGLADLQISDMSRNEGKFIKV